MIKSTLQNYQLNFIILLFTIVIADCFFVAISVLIPLKAIFESFASVLVAIELIFVFILIVFGWVGYIRSINRKPHTDNGWGWGRFCIDIAIIFCFFYLIHLIPKHIFKNEFLYVILIIFGFFIIWDLFKNKEYFKVPHKKSKMLFGIRSGTTLKYFGIYCGLIISYELLKTFDLIFKDEFSLEITFIIFAAIFYILYRKSKWKLPAMKNILD